MKTVRLTQDQIDAITFCLYENNQADTEALADAVTETDTVELQANIAERNEIMAALQEAL